MEITKQAISHIEKALGFKLYEYQVNYLLDKGSLLGGRRTGKTIAYCIKLSLSDGEPLDLRKPEKFSDYGGGNPNYPRDFFRREFMRVREILKNYGFPVIEVRK